MFMRQQCSNSSEMKYKKLLMKLQPNHGYLKFIGPRIGEENVDFVMRYDFLSTGLPDKMLGAQIRSFQRVDGTRCFAFQLTIPVRADPNAKYGSQSPC